MNLELNVVRFENEDVIATSGVENWSEKSYRASTYSFAGVETNNNIIGQNWVLAPIEGNVVDGVQNNDMGGEVLELGKYYHYVPTGTPYASQWKTCTDESHRDDQ